MAVGWTGMAVGWTGMAVGWTGMAVGWTGMAVGWTVMAVGSTLRMAVNQSGLPALPHSITTVLTVTTSAERQDPRSSLSLLGWLPRPDNSGEIRAFSQISLT